MEHDYWIGRKRASMAMARRAATSEARLIHLHLAGCYSVKAVESSRVLHAPSPADAERALSARRDRGEPR